MKSFLPSLLLVILVGVQTSVFAQCAFGQAQLAPPIAVDPETIIPCEPEAVKTKSPGNKTKGWPNWSAIPPVERFPRPGNAFLAPTGEGYYSLRDFLTGELRSKPPKYGYPRFGLFQASFFNADWRYLETEGNTDFDFFDPLKRIHPNDNWLFTTGGGFRMRYNHEENSRLSGRDNFYSLMRTRVFGDLWFRDRFRLYGEFLDAHSFSEDLPPLPIDENRSDLLNLFVDVKLSREDAPPIYMRVGRQELLYGSQRLISPLEWGNTRRTFQGLKVFRQGENWDVDIFAVQPVRPDTSSFDWVINGTFFGGAWATYHPEKNRIYDFYVLNFDSNRTPPPRLGIPNGNTNITTIGSRSYGDRNNFLWDVEGAMQIGQKAARSLLAGMFTSGVGYHFKERRFQPQFWIYYDYASGDSDPTRGVNHTFTQLFPFGHYYLGFVDVVGRQNIHDVSFHVAFFPTNWITTVMQFHVFRLDHSRDALYNAAGVPLRRSPTGTAGHEVGEEFDLLVNFHLTKHQDILVSYSHFLPGRFIRETGSARASDYLYLQWVYRW